MVGDIFSDVIDQIYSR